MDTIKGILSKKTRKQTSDFVGSQTCGTQEKKKIIFENPTKDNLVISHFLQHFNFFFCIKFHEIIFIFFPFFLSCICHPIFHFLVDFDSTLLKGAKASEQTASKHTELKAKKE